MTAIAKAAKTHPAAKKVVAGKNLPYGFLEMLLHLKM